ncbi:MULTISPECIES: Lrp/AsnC family transcriptional regulator [Lysobacter]|jgi:DNA-binding Lrp family transcriptional regulator|uniref:Lrp/AsnC family transcriptional regulator n=1 Tax=Lysobacter gummosus TaxID=262324 RepID=A0ABY3XCC5_9GAMM|nr:MULTISPECIES: Lrp/AsnC family transcriptional regulator [Lysobacter]MBT2745504.1 Lrp/AsnC family transcriptional regulator [Lysobacter sp. ISL-42]MBT2753443.1 Lrp/AsnC family transcriptional regulator [Lysobacter sp. ISL-50]MBT2777173.1 Lrp/AsnC family transcriptional regulator [Lysobacter sp. ISL-54]MBT2780201.1 Lrp/AsnC family transcriptional regulator [Lysobacter sp. ISL-52]UJB19921.1 Lrp/AsnC family transcriptional regulator [Lysobacter capsici]
MSAAPLILDEFDHKLLELLQQDASSTLSELGDAVGLSPSAVQRRMTRYRQDGLMRQVAVLDPLALGSTLAAVWVTMERESVERHAAFHARVRAAPEVQQCYTLAGEWDYLVILATTGVLHCRQVVDRLFLDEGNVKRYDTHLVFDVVKHGLELPTRDAPRAARKRRG